MSASCLLIVTYREVLLSKRVDLYFHNATQLPTPHFLLLYTSFDLKIRTVENGMKTKAYSLEVPP